MKQTKLVIASVLKPVNDIRLFEKFALSISQAKKYDINIIGFYAKNLPVTNNISFYPLFHFHRLSFKRILAPYRYLKTLLHIKPKIIIITTHELILPSLIFKLFTGAKLYYDVRENYYLNIKHTQAFPPVIKHLVALWVRLKEVVSSPFIECYFLAEKVYAKELHFTKNKQLIIENKSQRGLIVKREDNNINFENIKLLFTGTLAETTGVFNAIDLHQNLIQLHPEITLKIIGYCPDKNTLNRLQARLKNTINITLIGGDELVNHDAIMSAIKEADLGIIYYPPNVANDYSIPTKLYEYLAAQLPIITESKPQYIELLKPYNAAVYFDFENENIEQLIDQISTRKFYSKSPGNEVFWESEELKLLQILNS